MDARPLSPTLFVSDQIAPADLEQAAALGISLVVNNRPDGESSGQPSGSAIEQAAKAAGLEYAAIPIDHTGFGADKVDALAALLAEHEGRALLYCRSGTRSTLLWALAQATAGVPLAEIYAAAEATGYSLQPVAGHLQALSAQHEG